MGLRFRKSVNFGPFRVNLSKSGIGYSVGGKGARITKKAKGGFRATASVPGTGVSYTTDFGGKKSNSQRNSGKKQAVVPDTPNQPNSPKKKFSLGEALIALVLVLILVAASSCSDDSDNPTAQAEQPTTTIEQTEEQPKAEPENPDSYTLDYPDAESFESALNNGEKVNGKTVQFVVNDYKPDSKMGFNCWAGEHLNFISETGLDVSAGNIINAQITEEPSKTLGSWIIPYKVLTIAESSTEAAAAPAEKEENPAAEQPKAEPEKAETTKNNTVVAVAPIVQQPKEQAKEPVAKQPKAEPATPAAAEKPKTEQPTTTPKAEPEQTVPAAPAEKPKEQPKAEQPTTTPKTEQAAPAAAEKPKEQPKAEQPATTPKAEPEQTAPAAPAESKEVAYVLNTSSKKFHSPNCADVKRISSENYGTCSSREEAVSMGYKPCGHCKP